jgi:hypothetical protein
LRGWDFDSIKLVFPPIFRRTLGIVFVSLTLLYKSGWKSEWRRGGNGEEELSTKWRNGGNTRSGTVEEGMHNEDGRWGQGYTVMNMPRKDDGGQKRKMKKQQLV